MATINRVTIMGHLGRDPELKQFGTNKPFLVLSVATSEGKGDKQQETQWHSVTLYGDLAKRLHTQLRKGDQVFLEGSLKYSSVGEGQNRRFYTNIQTFHVAKVQRSQAPQGEFRPQTAPNQPAPTSATPTRDVYPPMTIDDIPF